MNSLFFLYGFGMIQILISIVYLSSLFFSFGMIHALLFYWKKAWLKKVLANGNYSDDVKKSLENELEPAQRFPLYKYLKFYFSALSVVLIIFGLITILTKDSLGGESMKLFVFLPAVIGGIFYLIYHLSNKTNGLLRELTAAFMFVGFGITFVGFFPVYNLDFMRLDISVYISLAFGLFTIYHLNAVITSYLYMIAVILASASLSFAANFGSESLQFLTLLTWPFGIAILFFWIPRLEDAKKIELREITFGVLFALMMISLGVFNTSGFSYLALLAIIPALYMFSIKYYKQGNWYIEKPIQSIIALSIIIFSVGLSIEKSGFIFRNSMYPYTNDWGFTKVCSLLIIIGIGFIAFKKYAEEYKKKLILNHLFLLIGLVVFFLATFLGDDYRSDALVFLYAVTFGGYLTYSALKNKDEVILLVGPMLILIPLIIKIVESLDWYRFDQATLGGIMLIIGAILAGMVAFMRSVWTVTDTPKNPTPTTYKPEREELDQI
jgi:hypothetical protein